MRLAREMNGHANQVNRKTLEFKDSYPRLGETAAGGPESHC